MFLRSVILSAVVALLTATTAQAGFTISIGNASVTAGGTTTVDVMISGGPEFLDSFVTEFRITPLGSAAIGGLQFTYRQSGPIDPGYVFNGNSFFLSREVTTNISTADTLTIGDFTNDGLGVDVSGGRLLARLEL